MLSGAKVNIKNNDNWAPIHIAARKGQEKGIQTIIRLNSILKDKGLEQFDLNVAGGV
jgi:ankyrin repeat protein